MHLWTRGALPPEYLEFIFCRDIWHCPPDVYRRQSPLAILQTLTILDIEAEYRKAQTALG